MGEERVMAQDESSRPVEEQPIAERSLTGYALQLGDVAAKTGVATYTIAKVTQFMKGGDPPKK